MTNNGNTLDKKGYIDTKRLAKLWNLTERRIQQLAKDKIIKVEKIKGVNFYPLMEVWRQYTLYLQDLVNRRKKTEEELEKEKLEADIRLKQAKADVAQLDLKVLKAELLRAEDVKDYIEDLCSTMKSMLNALPGKLAMDLKNITSTVECSNKIEAAISGVLVELSNYKFSRKYYQKKVSEKYSRSVTDDDSEE